MLSGKRTLNVTDCLKENAGAAERRGSLTRSQRCGQSRASMYFKVRIARFSEMTVKMKVVQGKPRGSLLDFPDGEFVVGRGPECHIRPNSELVSRRHCVVRIYGQHVHVRDLGSTAGTFVNGTRIVDECSMDDGDTLQLGPIVLELVVVRGEIEVTGLAADVDNGPVAAVWRWNDVLIIDAEIQEPAAADLAELMGFSAGTQFQHNQSDTPIPPASRAYPFDAGIQECTSPEIKDPEIDRLFAIIAEH
jgi:predicted component of type VI protein secretion system